jgi:hypothetical protein
MNEPSDEKKAFIVANRKKKLEAQAIAIVKRKKIVKKRLAGEARFEKNMHSKYDVKPAISPEEKHKLALQFIRGQQTETRPEYQGMAIGFLMGSTKNPDLRGMIAGLSGLKNEKEK